MQNHFVYAKSAKGRDSVATHPHRLAARYRRFLALVDGQRSVAELETVARPHEMAETLSYLIANGFIEKIGERGQPEGLGQTQDDPFLAAALTPDMYDEFKRRAMVELEEKFGNPAATAVRRIGTARTPAELRAALREAEAMLTHQKSGLDPNAVRSAFQRIGRNFV